MSLRLRSLLMAPIFALSAGCFEDPGTVDGVGDSSDPVSTTGGSSDDDDDNTSGISGGTGGTASDDDDNPTASGSDGEQNLPEGEGCCDAHRGPGCNEPDVVECVCAIDVSCCGFDWTESCTEWAQGRCEASCMASVTAGDSDSAGSTGGWETTGDVTTTGDSTTGVGSTSTTGSGATTGVAGVGDCCDTQPTPGCEDTVVQDCTCALDSYCCDTQWDSLCVEQAVDQCMLVCEV